MNLNQFSSFCHQADREGVLFYYTGEFSQNVIGAMTDTLKQRLDSAGVSGPARRKIFSTFIEMAQNVLHYADTSSASGGHFGALAVGQADDSKYYVVCGNPVKTEHVERIKTKLEPLRSMTLDEIKLAYREQLRNEDHDKDTTSRGAGLGFLTVAREASAPIEYQILYHSDENKYAEFYLRATI